MFWSSGVGEKSEALESEEADESEERESEAEDESEAVRASEGGSVLARVNAEEQIQGS